MPALIGCQLPQARQAEAFCDSYMAREETIIHANDDRRRLLTVAPAYQIRLHQRLAVLF
jgi:hypothetical protein